MSIILDDPVAMAGIDRGNMLEQIMGFPDHLSSALFSDVDIEFSGRGICLCGMGGSAVSGDILADCVMRESDRFMSVVRGMDLPGWVGEDTLLIAVSYSGNTREVLTIFEKALDSDIQLVAISSGGRLGKLCKENGVPIVEVPTGFQPRAALGFLLGSTARVLEEAGVMSVATQLNDLISSLKQLQSTISVEVPVEINPAKRLAMDLQGTVPVIYAAGEMRSAALRWHTQMNENSKMMAFTGEVPECNHNHIVGWMEGSLHTLCRPVFLRAATDNPSVSDIMSLTIESLEEGRKRPLVADFDGPSRIQNLISAIVLGDLVSYYLAMLNGVDPLPVESIGELKRRML